LYSPAADLEGVSVDILELIKTRRSIRKYKTAPVSEEEINKILEAGRWAPSADNSQPWRFIVLRSQEVRKKLADTLTWGRFLSQAPMGIAVVVNPRASNHPVEDGAAATQNMLLEAHFRHRHRSPGRNSPEDKERTRRADLHR